MNARRLVSFLAGLTGWVFFLCPGWVGGQTIDPTIIQEESLSRATASNPGLVLEPGKAEALIADGAPLLVLRLANQILEQGRSPLAVSEWTQVKISALMALESFAEALSLLEGLSHHTFKSRPEFHLFLAQCYLSAGQFDKARDHYTRFMTDHADHPNRFEAQRGLGLVALQSGALSEAQLLLDLYAQDNQRPNPDPLLLIGLARLSQLKKDEQAAAGFFSQLSALTLEQVGRNGRQWIEAVALWHVEHNRWQQAFDLVESGLQKKFGSRLMSFYQELLKQALSAYHAKKKGVDGSNLMAIKTLLRAGTPPEMREAALDQLLAGELKSPIGLFQALGPLSDQGLLPHPLDPQLRYLLAKAHFRLNQEAAVVRPHRANPMGTTDEPEKKSISDQLVLISLQPPAKPMDCVKEPLSATDSRLNDADRAWTLLDRLPGESAMVLRLRLLAANQQPADADLYHLLRQPWPDFKLEGERIKLVVDVMFALTQRRQVIAAAQLRRLLSSQRENLAIRRALRYQQALDKQSEGEVSSALTLYLELAFDGKSGEADPAWDALLPQSPRQAAAKILVEQGAWLEAAELFQTP
ncbi:MAG: tetratricopeptide repeat protein [Magnetococcales bacterium]|nr:tetratricopeptide repeat protein [Magnetococcales bacterium]